MHWSFFSVGLYWSERIKAVLEGDSKCNDESNPSVSAAPPLNWRLVPTLNLNCVSLQDNPYLNARYSVVLYYIF